MQCVLDTLKPHSEWQRLYSEYVDLLKECKSERQKDIFATPAPPQPKAASSAGSSPGAGPIGDEAAGEEVTEKGAPASAGGSPTAVTTGTSTTTTTTSSSTSSSGSSSSGSGSSSSSSSSSSSLCVPQPAPSPSAEIQSLDSPTVCLDDELLSASSSLPPLDASPVEVSPASTSGGAASTSPAASVAGAAPVSSSKAAETDQT